MIELMILALLATGVVLLVASTWRASEGEG